jgi:sulfite exporter TauE/SafE
MHCAACEILIEKKLLKKENIEVADASTSDNEVIIMYKDEKPSIEGLNEIFKDDGYSFVEEVQVEVKQNSFQSFLIIFLGLILIILIYNILEKYGITSLVSIDSNSALSAFFLFGIVAGFSNCAALVGGIVLSMSKQWYELYSKNGSFVTKLQPHFLFNLGRIVSFAILGGLLGVIGSVLTISPLFMSIISILVALLMVLLGLQMLGIKAFQRFQFRVPKVFSRYIADESNFAGKYMPVLMGALTFFLPCGFTLTAQAVAIISASPVRGALIMSLFALGTSPMLLLIGVSSTKIYENAGFADSFMKLVGIFVASFGFITIYNQLVVLGFPSINELINF